MNDLRWLALTVALGAVVPVLARVPAPSTLEPGEVTIEARPFILDAAAPDREQFGQLRWGGGLALTSTTPHFGGISGLSIDASGKKLLMVSDGGAWFSADLIYEGDRLVGVANGKAGIIEDANGKPLASEREWDAESLSSIEPGAATGRFLIGFERNDRVKEYDFDGNRMKRMRSVALGDYFDGVKNNEGPEAMTALRGKTDGVVVFAEGKTDEAGAYVGVQRTDKGKLSTIKMATLNRQNPTGIEALSDGSFVVVHRFFSRAELLFTVALSRVAVFDEKQVASHQPLFESAPGIAIDNWEGIASHTREDGTVLTVISDDNFNPLQRTLLMQFVLKADAKR